MPRANLQLVKTAAASPPERPSPPGKHSDKYNHHVQMIHSANEAGGGNVLRAFYLLLEFEKAAICWRTSPQVHFRDIIREERFCAVARYHAFKRAVGAFRKEQIKRLGLNAVCLIIKQPEKYRNKLLKRALTFRNRYNQEPTYQQLTLFVREIVPRETKPTYAQLRNRCDQLEEFIRNQGLRIPVKANTTKEEE